jgi:hypothetical protein
MVVDPDAPQEQGRPLLSGRWRAWGLRCTLRIIKMIKSV